jgi:large subunit ribosomal protein L24
MAKIRKGDFVEVISGKDKGRTGKILKIFPEDGKCLVEKVGVVKRHQKAKAAGQVAGIIEKSMKIHLCKVMLLDPKTKKPSRVKYAIEGGKKVRRYVKSGDLVEASAA